jgi:hypothetical protein
VGDNHPENPMSLRLQTLRSFVTAAALMAASACASAAAPASASCTVSVNYLLNNVLVEPYTQTFVVQEGVDFVDDFSTVTRFKIFTASAVREAGKAVVKINYFNDVGVFNSIDLDTSVVVPKGQPGSTSGRHTFSTSTGSAGNHTTQYSLTCTRG